jgi:hypothetical protein
MSDGIPVNLWDITETQILSECDDDVKKNIVDICSNHSLGPMVQMDKKTQHVCFLAACMSSNDLEFIDRMINDFKIDVNYLSDNGDNCLTLACRNNTNLEIIKFLINDLKMDQNHTNINGSNCLLFACRHNTNLEIIKYLINDLNMDVNHKNFNSDDCLTLACYNNTNLEIIKYLIDDLKMDVNHTDDNGDSCLSSACWNNTNLEIIKYLIQDLRMNTNHTDKYGNSCLTLACWNNTNLEIIKYLIQDLRMDVNHTNITGVNCFTIALSNNTNLEIAKYLIESTSTNVWILHQTGKDIYENWKKIVKLISKNFNRFRDSLVMGLKVFASHNDDLIDFLKTLNPLLLIGIELGSEESGSDIVHRLKFNDYVHYVDKLHSFIVPIYEHKHKQSCDDDSLWSTEGNPKVSTEGNPGGSIPLTDYTKNSTILFNHNGSEYYGYRDIVYDSILCLKEIKDVANFDQLITLSSRIPKYIMNLWIGSMYSKRFNLMSIRPEDIIPFLEHIDQYPTDFLTICTIENDLIKYLDADSHEIVFGDMIPCLKTISMRCRLKRLYLWIHNKQNNQ